MKAPDTLLEDAKAVLASNNRGSYTIPAEHIYPHQWLWDSCFIAIGLRHYDINRAQKEILSLIAGQWQNGMIPHMIIEPHNRHAVNFGSWQSWLSPFSPNNLLTSGITQPPMLAEAVTRVGEKLEARERLRWYRLVWPNLIGYHDWLYSTRDPRREGLITLVHPWESGIDNSPPWMDELHKNLLPWWIQLLSKIHLINLIKLARADAKQIPLSQRMSNIDALALFDIQLRLRRKLYDASQILAHPLFAVQDLNFNCILIRANTLLRNIATAIREPIPQELANRFTLADKALEQLWDPHTESYYSRDFTTRRLQYQQTVASLMPLYTGTINSERAKLLVRQLENEQIFGVAYPIPSVPVNSSWFKPNCYWQGPTWVNMNWLIIDGLRRYGYYEHANTLRDITLELVTKNGAREYFNPLSGTGLGASKFSWTAALTIDLLNQS